MTSNSLLRFDGRVAIVTGAGRGLGREHALLLAKRGAKVVVNDFGGSLVGEGASPLVADEVVDEIVANGGTAVADHHSVADEDGPTAILRSALDAFGQVDIVINNAGILEPASFEKATAQILERHWRVHFLWSALLTRAVWPHLRAARYGRVVMTCSGGIFGVPGLTPYTSAKGAVFALIRSLAGEGAPLGILVNGIAPGAATRMSVGDSSLSAEDHELIVQTMRPELVSPTVAFLAHESCALNGELLTAAGGRVASIFLAETAGARLGTHSPEDVAAVLERIFDRTRYCAARDASEITGYGRDISE